MPLGARAPGASNRLGEGREAATSPRSPLSLSPPPAAPGARADPLEALRRAQELDDLAQLLLRLLDARDVVERDPRGARRLDRPRLHARHQLQRAPEQVDDQSEEDDREPGEEQPREV